jgi:hypothetical protein
MKTMKFKKYKKKSQKIWKMKGCNKKGCNKKGCNKKGCHRGGGCGCNDLSAKLGLWGGANPSTLPASDFNLAYTGNVSHYKPNPFLAYTGSHKMGGTMSKSSLPYVSGTPKLPYQTNINSSLGVIKGGTHTKTRKNKKGGYSPEYVNKTIPYPNGLVGDPWTPKISGWPGIDNISGNRNYLAHNDYKVDPQTAMISERDTIWGGKTNKRMKKIKKTRGRKGAGLIPQDLVNMGRQLSFQAGSTYNALRGYAAPINPLPTQDQLVKR